jgi:hypothetical protein
LWKNGRGEITVNLATEKAQVTFDPDKTGIAAIKERIEKADTAPLKSLKKSWWTRISSARKRKSEFYGRNL